MSDDNFIALIKQLKSASEECWAAKIALHDISQKYAPLCIQLLVEGRKIPRLINSRIEKRQKEMGLDPVHPDFWDADMIIALYEHFEEAFLLEEVNHGKK